MSGLDLLFYTLSALLGGLFVYLLYRYDMRNTSKNINDAKLNKRILEKLVSEFQGYKEDVSVLIKTKDMQINSLKQQIDSIQTSTGNGTEELQQWKKKVASLESEIASLRSGRDHSSFAKLSDAESGALKDKVSSLEKRLKKAKKKNKKSPTYVKQIILTDALDKNILRQLLSDDPSLVERGKVKS